MFKQNCKQKPAWVLEKEKIAQTPIGEIEVVSLKGVDGVKDGKLPNGLPYTWKKRRPWNYLPVNLPIFFPVIF